jgi:ribonuclease HI
VLLGDFNAHSPLWGDTMADGSGRGRMLETFINDNDLVILNNGQKTRFNSFNGDFSAIDLFLCSPNLTPLFEFAVHNDLCGSDHFPIIVNMQTDFQPPGRPAQWSLKRANWKRFAALADLSSSRLETDVPSKVKNITETLVKAAEESIPQTSTKPRRIPVPWWNQDCDDAIKARKKALRIFSRRPTKENLMEFRRLRAKARQVVKSSQRKSWQAYVSSINCTTSSTKVWHRANKIKGRHKSTTIAGIESNNHLFTAPKEIADCIGQHFADVSSSHHYSASFQQTKLIAERRQLSFVSANNESYNMPFSEWELDNAIRTSKNTSPGADRVHNEFLKHLLPDARAALLDAYNNIWISQVFPDEWRHAIQVPIHKPGKDKKLAASYRPISLTSCLCKVMERMVNNRLVWWLETKKLLSNLQCGFRKNRSTLDHLIRMEAFIQDSFLCKQHSIAVFFDLEKAYDTTWRFNILKSMSSWGFKGRLPVFITNFMTDRTFNVRVGDVLSDTFTQENGVPQGSVLSVTLFAIAINGITDCVKSPVSASLFVDDLAIICRSRSIATSVRQIQMTVNKLVRWADSTGFKFSETKTSCMHFSRHRGLFPDPDILIKGHALPFVNAVKFLGLWFDQKLNWKENVRQLRIKCQSSLNLLRVLAGTSWGADRTVMLRLYRALVRSKLDYGSVVYASARESYLKPLNTVHNTGIRLATGALRTSRLESLYCEASEPPLALRRQYLLTSYAAKLLCMKKHPTFVPLFKPSFEALYDSKPSSTLPAGIRLNQLFVQAAFRYPKVYPHGLSATAPWITRRPTCLTSLTSNNKNSTSPIVYRKKFAELSAEFKGFIQIFTDGSKDDSAVGSAFISNDISYGFKLNDKTSILTAELYALVHALKYIESSRQEKSFLICSDSLSSLQAIDALYSPHTLVQEIHSLLTSLASRDVTVVFCWVPGHVGIQGNELADRAAKAATEKDALDDDRLCANDLKNCFKSFFKKKFQTIWDQETNNKLKEVKNTINSWDSSIRSTRREEVVLTRLRIGHTLFSHAYLFSLDKIPPRCDTCNEALSVRHVLVDCTKYRGVRRRLSLENNIAKVLGDDPKQIDKLFKFLRAIDILRII